jgi:hypothetical protein
MSLSNLKKSFSKQVFKCSFLVVMLFIFTISNNQKVEAATYTYDFESDLAGSSPANTLVENLTFNVLNATSGMVNKSLGSIYNATATIPANILMSNFPTASNYSVV